MAEPVKSDPVKDPCGMLRTVPSWGVRGEALAWLRNPLRQLRSNTGSDPYVWRWGTQSEEIIRVAHRAGNSRGMAQALAETIETNLPLAADRIGFLVDPQPLSFSEKPVYLSWHAPIADYH